MSFKIAPDGSGSWLAQTFEVYGLTNGSGESWVEGNGGTDNNPAGEITWNNAPTTMTLLGSFTGSGTGYKTFTSTTLTNFVKADTDNQVTIIVKTTGTTIQSLEDRVGTNKPILTVTH